MFLQITLYFNWMELEHMTVSVGAIHYGASGIVSTCIRTVTLLCGRLPVHNTNYIMDMA